MKQSIYQNSSKNQKLDKEALQKFGSERLKIIDCQATSENQNFEEKSTLPKTHSSSGFGINLLRNLCSAKNLMIVLTILFFLPLFIHWRSLGFSPDAITIPLLNTPDPICDTNDFIWPKEFVYLGKGKQAFAFESKDSQYVIKFFDRNRMEIPWYHIFATKKWIHRREAKQLLYPESYRLAYQTMKDETQLIQVHMGVSQRKLPTITVKDRASRLFPIDLNHVPFILQKKAPLSFLETLEACKRNSNELHAWIDQYIQMNHKRIHLLIANQDKHIQDNYRCNGKTLIYIDPGRYYINHQLRSPAVLKEEWIKATYELRRWIQTHAPQVVSYFDQKVATELDNQYN